jgi:Tol biopolymer transport system component
MFLDKLTKWMLFAFVVTGLLASVVLAAVPPIEPPSPPRAPVHEPPFSVAAHLNQPAVKTDPKPLPKGPNKLLFFESGILHMIDPDGKNETKLSEKPSGILIIPTTLRLSPDGKKLAYLAVNTEKQERGKGPTRVVNHRLHFKELTDKGLGTDLEIDCLSIAWSADGSQIATSDWIEQQVSAIHYLVDVKTKEKKKLMLPDNHFIADWTPDGKYLLTRSWVKKDDKQISRLHLMNLDGTEHKVLTDEKTNATGGRVSPDGTRVLCSIPRPPDPKEKVGPKGKPIPPRTDLHVLHLDSGKLTLVADIAENGTYLSSCWSQDGKQIAYVWRQKLEIKADDKPIDIMMKEVEIHIMVCDETGKNHKSLFSRKVKNGPIVMGGVEWR